MMVMALVLFIVGAVCLCGRRVSHHEDKKQIAMLQERLYAEEQRVCYLVNGIEVSKLLLNIFSPRFHRPQQTQPQQRYEEEREQRSSPYRDS